MKAVRGQGGREEGGKKWTVSVGQAGSRYVIDGGGRQRVGRQGLGRQREDADRKGAGCGC